MSRGGVFAGGRAGASARAIATDLTREDGVPGAEAQLWACVLFQVLVDLVSQETKVRVEAEMWVGKRPTRAFAAVCSLAGVEDVGTAHAALRAVAVAPLAGRRGMVPGLEKHSRGASTRWAMRDQRRAHADPAGERVGA